MVRHWSKVYLNVAILVIKHSIQYWRVVFGQYYWLHLSAAQHNWKEANLSEDWSGWCPLPSARAHTGRWDLIQFKLCTLRCSGPARPQPPAKTGTKDKYLKSCSIAELRLVVVRSLEVSTKVPEDVTITVKAPNRAISWLKVSHLRHH